MESQSCCIPSCTPCAELLASTLRSSGTAEFNGLLTSSPGYQVWEVVMVITVLSFFLTFLSELWRHMFGISDRRITVIQNCYDGRNEPEDQESEEQEQDEEPLLRQDQESEDEDDEEPLFPEFGQDQQSSEDEGDEPEENEPEENEPEEDEPEEDEPEEDEPEEDEQETDKPEWEMIGEGPKLRRRSKSSNESPDFAKPLIDICKSNGVQISPETEKFFHFINNMMTQQNGE